MTFASELGITQEMAERILDLHERVKEKLDHLESFDIDYNDVQNSVPFNIYHLVYPLDDPSQK